VLWLGLALAAYDTPQALTGGALRRAERRCRRGNEDACAVVGFTFLFQDRGVEGEALIHGACQDRSQLGCHLQAIGVLEGWWPGNPDEATSTLTQQCLVDDVALSCFVLGSMVLVGEEGQGFLEHGCELGDAMACGTAATRRYHRTGELDVPRLEVACSEGYDCDYLARALLFGMGVEAEPERGLRLGIDECNKGSGKACTDVAVFTGDMDTLLRRCETADTHACERAVPLLWELGREDEARAIAQPLCEAGLAGPCMFMAAREDDERRKLEYAARGCDGGSTWGCWLYGAMLLHGRGTDAQPRAARPLLEQSCEDGVPGACNSLAVAYSFGCGVEPDQEQAAELWGQACDLGFVGACGNLGEHLWYTEGPELGEPMLRQACAAGSAWACGTLGSLIEDREQGLQMLEEACEARPDGSFCVLYWEEMLNSEPEYVAELEQSCAQAEVRTTCNDADLPWASMSHRACAVLGELYLEGLHVVRDEDYGAELITRACEEGGDYEGCRLMESLQE
jgi:uncharacterized protein